MIGKTVDWKASGPLVDYEEALAFMEQRVADIVDGSAPETVWLLEHPSLYTAGTSARPDEILTPNRFPVYATGRGGRYTYHGPGQRVAYVMLDLRRRGNDIRAFVHNLEEWLILTLQRFAIQGERRQDRVGIWVQMENGREAKIGAIGVRVRRWITFHGVALNVHPDLTHFDGIVPCGVTGHGVTSLDALGVSTTMADVDAALKATFSDVFGTTESMPSPRVAAR